MSDTPRMPVVFFGHGSPTNALEDNVSTRAWARIAGIVGRPKAILSISAHWCTSGMTAVTAMERPRTIHDFGRSLPAPLFDIQYPAPGDPELAARVCELLAPMSVQLDQSWGLDHGTWSVLSKAYPEADIPVVQLSVDMSRPGSWHYDMGRKLGPLRDENVLIIGSGNVVHNLGVMDWDEKSEPYDWAVRFNDFARDCITRDTPEKLFDYDGLGGALGDDAARAIPGPDHYWPLLYALGARHRDDNVSFDPDFIQYRSLSMMSVLFDSRQTG